MKNLYVILSWGFGVLFLLMGLVGLADFQDKLSLLFALAFIAISAFLLPPVRDFLYSKTNKKISGKVRAFSIFSIFMALVFFTALDENQKKQELAQQQIQEKAKAKKEEQLRQKATNYFNANREQIFFSINKSISEKDYQSAISQSEKYLVAGDKMLEQLNAKAKNELASIERNQKKENLLAELKNVAEDEYERNRDLYSKLSNLDPQNEIYKDKRKFFAEKIKEEKQKEVAAEARKKQIEPQFSPFDGSHFNLERVIKDSMNDPDSYEHVQTSYWDRGDHLIVETTFRGKNAFGAVVKNSVKAKVSLDGRVLYLLNQD